MKALNRSINVEEAHMSTYNNTTVAPFVAEPSLPPTPTQPPPQSLPQSRKIDLRKQLASQLSGGSGKHCNVLKKQSYVSKPTKNGGVAGGQSHQAGGGAVNGHYHHGAHGNQSYAYHTDPSCILPVFRFLGPIELSRCALVCRSWASLSADPTLWRRLDVTGKRLTAACLASVVKRQPLTLVMDWTAIAKRQLEWLISKLNRLQVLSLQGCSWSGVTALRSNNVVPPLLASLDLSFVTGMTDAALRDVLSPPSDTSSNDNTNRCRFRNLRILKLAGIDITDVSLRYIVQYAPNLVELDLSQNVRITDAGIAQLTTPVANAVSTLEVLDLSGCKNITDASLDHLLKCSALRRLNMKLTPNINTSAINKFLEANSRFSANDTRLLIKSAPELLHVNNDDDDEMAHFDD